MKCIRPTYVGEFVCNGSACSSRCCRNWSVAIDRDTYKKFLALERADILSKLERDNDSITVRLEHNGDCPFLRDDLLCSIQCELGEDHLAAVCQAYPRITYQLGDTLTQSLTLTCPVAARSILLSDAPITFEIVDIDRPRFCFDWTPHVDDPDRAIELQLQSIELLQDRSKSINKRLIELCELFDARPSDHHFDLDRHSELMVKIFERMYSIEMSDEKKSRLKKIYVEHRAEILSLLEQGSVLENYLVNEFFMRCYPFAFNGGERLNCRIFVTGFRAMEFALTLTVISKLGRLTVDELLSMIDAVNERLDHNRGGMVAVRDAARSLENVSDFAAAMLDNI